MECFCKLSFFSWTVFLFISCDNTLSFCVYLYRDSSFRKLRLVQVPLVANNIFFWFAPIIFLFLYWLSIVKLAFIKGNCYCICIFLSFPFTAVYLKYNVKKTLVSLHNIVYGIKSNCFYVPTCVHVILQNTGIWIPIPYTCRGKLPTKKYHYHKSKII